LFLRETIDMKNLLINLILSASLMISPVWAEHHGTHHQCKKDCSHHKKPTLYKLKNLELSQAYIRTTSKANMPSAAYIVINNMGIQDDKLISVQSDISNDIQIHETKVDDKGVMTMTPVTTGLVLKANSKTELKPRATHIMLNNVTEPLLQHNQIPLKLVFEKSGTRMISFTVQDIIGQHDCCVQKTCDKCGDQHPKSKKCHH
jgi:copper(I)-binding protein